MYRGRLLSLPLPRQAGRVCVFVGEEGKEAGTAGRSTEDGEKEVNEEGRRKGRD